MENATASPSLVCSKCESNPRTGLQAVHSKDGGTVCKACAEDIDQSTQRTLVLHKFFEQATALPVNLTIQLPFLPEGTQDKDGVYPFHEFSALTVFEEVYQQAQDIKLNEDLKELFDCPICCDLLFGEQFLVIHFFLSHSFASCLCILLPITHLSPSAFRFWHLYSSILPSTINPSTFCLHLFPFATPSTHFSDQ